MKSNLTLVFVLSIFLFSNKSQAVSLQNQGNDTPENLAKAVYEALKNNDFEAYQSLILDEGKVKAMISKSSIPEDDQEDAGNFFIQEPMETRQNAKASFEEAVNPYKDTEFDWESSKISNIIHNEAQEFGLNMSEIYLVVESGHLSFTVLMPKNFQSDAWYMSSDIELQGLEGALPAATGAEYLIGLTEDGLMDGWYNLDEAGTGFGGALFVDGNTMTVYEHWEKIATLTGFEGIETSNGWTSYNFEMEGTEGYEYYLRYKKNEGEDDYLVEVQYPEEDEEYGIKESGAVFPYVEFYIVPKEVALRKY